MPTSFNTIAHEAKRPMLTLRTPMKDIPPEFAMQILPHLAFHGFEPCWIWMGPVNKDGLPISRAQGTMRSMRKRVAKMFWDYPEEGVVRITCPNLNCLNPAHMVLCHPSWPTGAK